jgi:UPF0176 protein
MDPIVVATLYKFVAVEDPATLRTELKALCEAHQVKGTLLIAPEGINGTIAATRVGIDAFLGALRTDARFADIRHQESLTDEPPFKRLKVRLKREIVTFGVPEANPNLAVGRYVSPRDWNTLIQDPDVLVIDTRNDYEYAVGTFEGAVDPKTATFGEFPQYVETHLDPSRHRKIAMFCTGGIRCEKATSYMLQKGFEEVYHLDGGILNYLASIPREESLWRGQCFVFDEREVVDHAQGTNGGEERNS